MEVLNKNEQEMPKGIQGFQKGNTINLGKHRPKAVRDKISETMILRGVCKGENNPMFGVHLHHFGKEAPFYGKYHSSVTKKNLSDILSGKNNPMYGVHRQGKDNPNWRGGITSLAKRIRLLPEYVQWRLKVFQRDNFTCQSCGDDKGGNLHAHHSVKPFAEILAEFLQEYDQFSPYDDKDTLVRLAMKYDPFWDITNGVTICKKCHEKLHSLVENCKKEGGKNGGRKGNE